MNRVICAAAVGLLLIGACASPRPTSAPATGSTQTATAAPSATAARESAAHSATAVAVTLQDFKIDASTTTVPANVEFDVHSNGPTPHNFTLRDSSGKVVLNSKDLHTGDSDVVTGQLAAGTYTFFCAFPGHESLGMHGTLTVTP